VSEPRDPFQPQAAYVDEADVEHGPEVTDTEIYEGELEAQGGAIDAEQPLEGLGTRELREGETDDPAVAAEEGLTYVPPMDPPVAPSADPEGIEVAAGFGTTARDEPFDLDHHGSALSEDDEMEARVREALRADAATSRYADAIVIGTRGGTVALRGTVDDIEDGDAIAAVAEAVTGVVEVIDELEVRE
jgi:hypothetical protein